MKGQWERGSPCSDDSTVWSGKLKAGRTVRDSGLDALWTCRSERSVGLLHIWEAHDRVVFLELPSSQDSSSAADLTFRPTSHPFIWPGTAPARPHLPTKAISSVISKSSVPALWNIFCPTPTTERFIVSPFSGTLKYCHLPQKSSFSFSQHSSKPKEDSMPSLSPCLPAPCLLGICIY